MTDVVAISLVSLGVIKNIATILHTFEHIWQYSQLNLAPLGSGTTTENARALLEIAYLKLKHWRKFWGIQDGDDDTVLAALWGRSAVNAVRHLLQSMHQVSIAIDKTVSATSIHLRTQQKASFPNRLGIPGPGTKAAHRRYSPVQTSEISSTLQDNAHEIQKKITNLCRNIQSLEPLSETAFRVRRGPIPGIDGTNMDLGPSFRCLTSKRTQLRGFVDHCQLKDFALNVHLFDHRRQTEHPAQPSVQATHILLVIDNTTQATGDVSRCFLVREGSNDLPKETIKYAAGANTATDIFSLLRSHDSQQRPADQHSKFIVQHNEKTYVIEESIVETCSGVRQHCSTSNFAQIPLMEDGVALTIYEKLEVACSLADHALLLLGSVWASCFTAINLRRQRSSHSQGRWTLHVHDPLADLSHLKPVPILLIQNQILDFGFLLIGLALGRRFVATGSDVMMAVAGVLPEVEMSIGYRFHNACMFCLTCGSAKKELCTPDNDELTPSAILRAFFLEVCTPLQAVKEALSYRK